MKKLSNGGGNGVFLKKGCVPEKPEYNYWDRSYKFMQIIY